MDIIDKNGKIKEKTAVFCVERFFAKNKKYMV